jgi:hypothetical protein
MADTPEASRLNIDGVDYDIESLSEVAKSQIINITFSDEQILQLQNELAVSNTARNGYLKALRAELENIVEAGS